MRRSLGIFGICLTLAVAALAPAQASDPLRLDETFRLLHLNPYVKDSKTADSNGVVFSIQNGGSQPLDLVLRRPPLNDLAVALGLQSGSRPALRLFSSDSREFAAPLGSDAGLAFSVPAGQVHSFFVPQVTAQTVLYLWSPEQLASHQTARQTFYGTMLLMLATMFVLAVAAAIVRRSRRAAYGVTMGGGLLVLLASLWLRDVLPDGAGFQSLMPYRLTMIQAAFGIGVVMSLVAHLNLVIRVAINRNYWTRVIIFADATLVAAAGFWTADVLTPGFAGIVGAELGDIMLVMTCAIVLLGAFFVPDRR